MAAAIETLRARNLADTMLLTLGTCGSKLSRWISEDFGYAWLFYA